MGRNQINCPEVTVPFTKIPQPDGSILLKPGRPVIAETMITTSKAARLLGMSRNWIIAQCEAGNFRTAHKPGFRPKSQWRISLKEVLDRRPNAPPDSPRAGAAGSPRGQRVPARLFPLGVH
jgi:hypothetical protein